MTADVQKGLIAISLAAISIAAEYSSGDALSKATIDDVSAAFAAGEGKSESLSRSASTRPLQRRPKGTTSSCLSRSNNDKADAGRPLPAGTRTTAARSGAP